MFLFSELNQLTELSVLAHSKQDCMEARCILLVFWQHVVHNHRTFEVVFIDDNSITFIEVSGIVNDENNAVWILILGDEQYHVLFDEMVNRWSPVLLGYIFDVDQLRSVLPYVTVLLLESVSEPVLLDVLLFFVTP